MVWLAVHALRGFLIGATIIVALWRGPLMALPWAAATWMVFE